MYTIRSSDKGHTLLSRSAAYATIIVPIGIFTASSDNVTLLNLAGIPLVVTSNDPSVIFNAITYAFAITPMGSGQLKGTGSTNTINVVGNIGAHGHRSIRDRNSTTILNASDTNTFHYFTNPADSSAITVGQMGNKTIFLPDDTLPTNGARGSEIELFNNTTNLLKVAAPTGVSIQSRSSFLNISIKGAAVAKCISSTNWVLIGALEA